MTLSWKLKLKYRLLDSCPVAGCETYSLYSNHREHERICHSNIAIVRLPGDNSHIVVNKVDERYGSVLHCPFCKDLVYSSTSGLQKHISNKHKKATADHLESDHPLASQATTPQMSQLMKNGQETLVQSRILRQINCSFNTAYRLLICNTCEHAVDPSDLQMHVRQHNKSLGSRDKGTLIKEHKPIGKKSFLQNQPPCHDAIKGIKENPRGYICGVEGCNTVRSGKVSLRNHCRSQHPGEHAFLTAKRGPIQSVFGPGTHCNRVVPSIKEEEIGVRAAAYLKSLPVTPLEPIDSLDEQAQTPFLRESKWLSYYISIGQGDRAISRQAYQKLAHPTQLSGSEKAMREYFREYTEMLRPLVMNGQTLSLKWVNSKE